MMLCGFDATSLGSNSWRDCTELVTFEFSVAFKLCRYRVDSSSHFATVTFFAVFKMCWHRVNALLDLCNYLVWSNTLKKYYRVSQIKVSTFDNQDKSENIFDLIFRQYPISFLESLPIFWISFHR